MRQLQNIFKIFSRQTWQQIVIAFLVFMIPVFIFVRLASEVREKDTLGFDDAVLRAVNKLSSPSLDKVVIVLTQFGGPVGVVVLTGGIAALLWQRRMRLMSVLLLLGVGGSAVLNVLLKAVFQRDRPQLWERIVTENSYSFPSGHAMASSALAFSLVVIFWPTRFRWFAVAAAVTYIVAIAFTRLYLGVHYPTDILAGWLVSGAWVAIVTIVLMNRTRLSNLLARNKRAA